MKFTLIRNATVLLDYGHEHFLIDPMLANKASYAGYPGTKNNYLRNPLVDLPRTKEDIINNIDYVLLSHLHPDHWDEIASQTIRKDQTTLLQNNDDKKQLAQQGFTNLKTIETQYITANSTHIIQTHCQHGSDAAYANQNVAEILGQASGFIFKNNNEKTIYFVGDTVWTKEIEENLNKYQPDIIVLHAGDAQIDGYGSIIMGKKDVLKVHEICPKAQIISIHMEAVNHCMLSRDELTNFVQQHNIAANIAIPNEGETLSF